VEDKEGEKEHEKEDREKIIRWNFDKCLCHAWVVFISILTMGFPWPIYGHMHLQEPRHSFMVRALVAALVMANVRISL